MSFEPLTTSEITNKALIELKYRGWYCWRQNQIRVPGRDFIGEPGLSDIIGFYKFDGRMLMCEVKKIGDTFSDIQRELLTKLKNAGGAALWATDDKRGGIIIQEYNGE